MARPDGFPLRIDQIDIACRTAISSGELTPSSSDIAGGVCHGGESRARETGLALGFRRQARGEAADNQGAIWSFHGAGFIVLAARVTALRLEHCRSSFMLVDGVLARALP
jgi:hypothetical protein